MWFVKTTFFIKVDESWNQFFDISCWWNRTYKSTKVAIRMIPTKQRLRWLKGCDLVPTLFCQDSVLTLATLKWDHLGGGIYDTWFYRWIVPDLVFLCWKKTGLYDGSRFIAAWRKISRTMFLFWNKWLYTQKGNGKPFCLIISDGMSQFFLSGSIVFQEGLTSSNLQVAGNCWKSMGRNDQLNISHLGGPC